MKRGHPKRKERNWSRRKGRANPYGIAARNHARKERERRAGR